MNIEEIANGVLTFDAYYSYSDDNRVYTKWSNIKKDLMDEINSLSPEDRERLERLIRSGMTERNEPAIKHFKSVINI